MSKPVFQSSFGRSGVSLSLSVDGAATEWAIAADGTASANAKLLSASDDGVIRAYQRD